MMVLANIPSCGIFGVNLIWYIFVRDMPLCSKVRKHVTLMVPYQAPYVTLITSSLV